MSAVFLAPESQARARAYVDEARPIFDVVLPGQDFFARAWDVRPLRRHAGRGRAELAFTRYQSEEALPGGGACLFADVLKAYLVAERNGLSNMVMRFDAGRMLWEALAERFATPADFRWASVTGDDLRNAEARMGAAWDGTVVYRAGIQLRAFVEMLAARGIVREPGYEVAASKKRGAAPSSAAVLTPGAADDGDEDARRRLPSAAAIRALARIYREATEPRDQLLAALCALAIGGGGFRAQELLTLPDDCEHTEHFTDEAGRDWSYGLRFYKEKSRDAARVLELRGCTPTQQRLVKAALGRIRGATDGPRRRADELAASPSTVPLPGLSPEAELTGVEAIAVLECHKDTLNAAVKRGQLRRLRVETVGGGHCEWPRTQSVFLARDVSTYLQGMRAADVVCETGAGGPATLARSLCVVFLNYLHPTNGTNRLLVEPVTIQHLNDWLGGRYERDPEGDRVVNGHQCRALVAPVFERWGLTEADGSPILLTTHDLRHWVTTVAQRGGLSDADLRLWQNREHAGDVDAYVHMTAAERVEWLKRGVREGTVVGAVAELYFQIAEDARDAWLDAHVQSVHLTALGMCVHDFSVEPCPFINNCVRQCGSYAVDSANEGHVGALVQLERRTAQSLARTRVVAEGRPAPAASWVRTEEQTLEGVRTVLGAVARARVDHPDGAVVRPFVERPSRFAPATEVWGVAGRGEP